MDRSELLAKRKEFFNDITASLSRELGELDKYFEQDKYYIKPQKDSSLIDIPNGELIFEVKGEFFNNPFLYLISIWQVGTKLKIGLLLKSENLFKAFAFDDQSEVLNVWGKDSLPEAKMIHGGAFYDWSFNAEHLYSDYMNQENYIMGIRHMHLRALKVICDYFTQEHASISYDQKDEQ